MHCTNLEAYLQIELGQRIEQDNFTGEAEKQKVIQTYSTLLDFTLKTGCRTQAWIFT